MEHFEIFLWVIVLFCTITLSIVSFIIWHQFIIGAMFLISSVIGAKVLIKEYDI